LTCTNTSIQYKSIRRIKVGHSSDITNRVSGFRTSNPFCKVLMVLYTYHSNVLETNMKMKYEKYLKPNNSEFITGIEIEELKKQLVNFANSLDFEYTIENDEEIDKFNRHIIKENEGEKQQPEENKEI
jgi:hypothetical protein